MITDNLRMYLETLMEQNRYYSALYKDYGSSSHRGYVRVLNKVIASFHRCMQSENPIERVERLVRNLEMDILVLKLMQPNTVEEYEEEGAYLDKLNRIKENIMEILNEEA